MSVNIVGNVANVHYLSTVNAPVLTRDQGILYVCAKGLGQVTRNSAEGLTPGQAFERRYESQKSSLLQDLVAEDIFVFDKIHGENYDYDDGVRALINRLHGVGLIDFHANVNNIQTPNTNSEALLDYDSNRHRDTLISVIKDYFGLSATYNIRKPFNPRYGQSWVIDNLVDGLVNHDRVLFAGYTGVGKSVISLEAIHRHFTGGGMVLITTPITETISSFVTAIDYTRFGNNPTRNTSIYTTKNMPATQDIVADVAAGNIVIVIATVQDMRYRDNIANISPAVGALFGMTNEYDIREKYADLCGIVDLWVRDEYHKEYGGTITSEVFKNIRTEKRLDLTATPYAVIDEYEPTQVISRTLMWAINNRIHTGVPRFGIDCLSGLLPKNMGKYADMFSESEGFHSHKLVERNITTGEFVNFNIIEDLLYNCYVNKFNRKQKNAFSIAHDHEISDVSRRVGLWIMPEGANGVSASEYIMALSERLNRCARINQHIKVTTAYDIDRLRGTLTVDQYVESIRDTRTLVILTHGKFKTGTDIPVLGHIVLLDSISNIAEFEQTVGRIERVYDGKEHTKMYVYSPSVTIKEVVAELAYQNKKLISDTPSTELEFLACFPITEYDGANMVAVSPTEIWDQFKQNLQLKSAVANFKLPNEIRLIIEGDSDIIDSLRILSSNGKRGSVNKSNLTESNGAVTFATTQWSADLPDPDEPEASKRKKMKAADTGLFAFDQRSLNKIIVGLEEIWTNVPPFAMITDDDNVITVLQCPPLIEMFGSDRINAVVGVLTDYPKIRVKLQERLNAFLTAFNGLQPEEIYDTVFKNCNQKIKQGLVFTPFTLVDDILEQIPMDKYNAKYGC